MTGSGTLLDPFIIWDVTDLQNMNLDLTAYYELGSNIDCSGIANFEPVGGWGGAAAFTGTFDGKGYTISNLTVNRAADNYVGLFGEIEDTHIDNVNLSVCSMKGKKYVGALIGYVYRDTSPSLVNNCHSTGSIEGNDDYAGGLIGYVQESTVENCHSDCTVEQKGDDDAGGLIGSAGGAGTLIKNSYATGNVTAADDYAGGFIGNAGDNITIQQCYATGNAIATDYAGGFAGVISGGTSMVEDCYATGNAMVGGGYASGGFASSVISGTITRCYSIGTPISALAKGGFIGERIIGVIVTACFWDKTTSGESDAVGDGLST